MEKNAALILDDDSGDDKKKSKDEEDNYKSSIESLYYFWIEPIIAEIIFRGFKIKMFKMFTSLEYVLQIFLNSLY